MNHLVWNCRGVGNHRTVRELLAFVQANVPKLVFLCVTRQASSRVETLKQRLGLRGFSGVDSNGLSGGLALFWDESLQVNILDKCDRYIDVSVVDQGSGTSWRTTYVYGEPRAENRHLMWEHLSRLRGVSDDPWLVCGDFNQTMWQHEHLSRSSRAESQMRAFRDVLEACELMDLGFSGAPYTNNNGQQGYRNVRVRLDHACADDAWKVMFPLA